MSCRPIYVVNTVAVYFKVKNNNIIVSLPLKRNLFQGGMDP